MKEYLPILSLGELAVWLINIVCLLSDATVVLQVALQVEESTSGGVIAGISIAAMAIGGLFLVVIDLPLIKMASMRFAKNIQTLRTC